jgi:hypothetical protein
VGGREVGTGGVDCEGAVGGDVEVGGGQEAAQDGVLKGEGMQF